MPSYAQSGRIQKPLAGCRVDLAHPLARGLVAHWAMVEGSGFLIGDPAGNRPATASGGVSWSPIKKGYAGPSLTLGGFGSSASLATAAFTAKLGNRFTLSAWVNPSNYEGETKILLTGGNTGPPRLQILSTGAVNGNMPGIGTVAQTNASVVPTGNWAHVVWSYRGGGDSSIWVNGAPLALASTASLTFIDASVAWTIGNIAGFNIFKGQVGEASLRSIALTDAEVAWLYREPFAMFAAPSTRRFFVPVSTGPAPITGALAAAADAFTAAIAALNTPPATTGTLAGTSGASTGAFAGTNTPPASMGSLAAVAGAASSAFDATNTPPATTATLAVVASASTVAFAASNVPPAIAGTLGASASSAATSLSSTNTPPATTSTLGAVADVASVAFAASNLAPPGSLVAVADSASGAFAGLVVPPATTGALASTAGASSVTFAASGVTPAITATLAVVAAASTTTIAMAAGGTVILFRRLPGGRSGSREHT